MKKHVLLSFLFISTCAFGQNKDFYSQNFFGSSIEKVITAPNEIIYIGQPYLDGESNIKAKGAFIGILDSNFKVKKRFDAGLEKATGSKIAFFERIDKNLLLIGTHSWSCDVFSLRSKMGTFNTLSGIYEPIWNGSNSFLNDVCYIKSGYAVVKNVANLHRFIVYDLKNWKETNLQIGLPSTEKINAVFGGNTRFYIYTDAKKWYSRSPLKDDLMYLGKTINIQNLASNESFQVLEENKRIVFGARKTLYLLDFQKDSVITHSRSSTNSSYYQIKYDENKKRIQVSSAGKIEVFDEQLQLLETHPLLSQIGSFAYDFFLQNNQFFYAGGVAHRPNPIPTVQGSVGGAVAAILPLQMPVKTADANLQNIDYQYNTPITSTSTTQGPIVYNVYFGKADISLKNTGTDTIRSVIFNLGHNVEPPAFAGCFPPIAKMWRFDSLAIAPNQQHNFELPKIALSTQEFTKKESMCIWISLVNDAPDMDSKNNTFCKEFATIVATGETPSELENILVFPNPASDFLTIQSSESIPLKIVIYDILGKPLLSQNTDNQNITNLDIAFLPKGIYWVSVENQERKVTKKIVK